MQSTGAGVATIVSVVARLLRLLMVWRFLAYLPLQRVEQPSGGARMIFPSTPLTHDRLV